MGVSIERLLLLMIGALCLLPAVFGLIRWVRRKAGKTTPVWPVVSLLLAALLLVSVSIDRVGVVHEAKVVDKVEEIRVTARGIWHRHLSLALDYADSEPRDAPGGVSCDARTFDRLRVGDTVRVRILDLWVLLKFARLSERSTLSIVRDAFPRRASGPPRRSVAKVRELTLVTKVYFRGTRSPRGGHSIALKWPYYVVELELAAPSGARVIAVDVIDAASAPNLAPGTMVYVSWPADDPRSAHIIGARPGSLLKNVLYDFGSLLAMTLALFIPIGLWRRARRKRTAQRRPMLPG